MIVADSMKWYFDVLYIVEILNSSSRKFGNDFCSAREAILQNMDEHILWIYKKLLIKLKQGKVQHNQI